MNGDAKGGTRQNRLQLRFGDDLHTCKKYIPRACTWLTSNGKSMILVLRSRAENAMGRRYTRFGI